MMRTYADILALYLAAEVYHRPADAAVDKAEAEKVGRAIEDEICKALQIDVLGRLADGTIRVYSEFRRQVVEIEKRRISNLKYDDLLSDFGDPAKACVSRTNEDNAPGFYPIRDVRSAIAYLSSKRTLGQQLDLGLGVWPAEGGGVLLVNSSEGVLLNGQEPPQRLITPRHGGQLLAFDPSTKPWHDFDRLGAMLGEADEPGWRAAVVDDLVTLLGRWRWRGKCDPTIMAGMVLATWIQDFWHWRPRVDVLGATSTGKSMLFDCLRGLFGPLAILTSDTTAAGLEQKIKNHLYAVLVDEADPRDRDGMREHKKILKMIRSAGRTGASRFRGSSHQQVSESSLSHIFWLAGIDINYDDAADRNRAICLNLLPATREMAGKLILPVPAQLADLGQRTLAAAIWALLRASKPVPVLALELKDHPVEGVDQRMVESYAVAAATVQTLVPGSWDGRMMLDAALSDTAAITTGESDEDALIGAILASEVRVNAGLAKTVGQVLDILIDPAASFRDDWDMALQRCGVKLAPRGHGPRPDTMMLIFNGSTVRRKLLYGTRFEDRSISTYLSRLPGHEKARRRMAGAIARVDMLPWNTFQEQFAGEESREPGQQRTF